MTLAFILVFGALSGPPVIGRVTPVLIRGQSQSTPDQASAPTKETQNSGATTGNSGQSTSGNATSTSGSQSSSGQGKKTSKHKKNSSVNCDSAAGKNTPSKSASSSNASNSAQKKSAATSGSACPPTKVIVQQGSTSEPSIELVGGAAGPQASDERNTANKMLETTEANLKKMDGAQLDSSQQDIVKQVHQFIDQSKAATTAGDLDQARTLAWKAELLSEELLKNQK